MSLGRPTDEPATTTLRRGGRAERSNGLWHVHARSQRGARPRSEPGNAWRAHDLHRPSGTWRSEHGGGRERRRRTSPRARAGPVRQAAVAAGGFGASPRRAPAAERRRARRARQSLGTAGESPAPCREAPAPSRQRTAGRGETPRVLRRPARRHSGPRGGGEDATQAVRRRRLRLTRTAPSGGTGRRADRPLPGSPPAVGAGWRGAGFGPRADSGVVRCGRRGDAQRAQVFRAATDASEGSDEQVASGPRLGCPSRCSRREAARRSRAVGGPAGRRRPDLGRARRSRITGAPSRSDPARAAGRGAMSERTGQTRTPAPRGR